MSVPSRRLSAVSGLLAGVSIAVTACGASSLPALTDPNEIIAAALKATESARSVHIDATLDGSISGDVAGTGGPASSFPLTGTTASADVDMASGKARATFAIPAFLNLNGDLIQIGPTTYFRSSFSGPLYETQEALNSLPVDPTNAAGIFDNVGDFLTADAADPVKGEDVDCGGKRCYTVMIELTSDELAALGAGQAVGDLPIDMGAANLAFTIRVEKDTYRLAGIRTVASVGDQGAVTIELALSKWDQPVDISPPPADQVKPAE